LLSPRRVTDVKPKQEEAMTGPRGPRRPAPGALSSGLWAFSAWCALPGLLASWLAPAQASLGAFGLVALALLATRTRRAGSPGCLLAAFAAAACAGALAQPAWLRAVARVGLLLGLAPLPPLLASTPFGVAPALWLGAGCVGPLAEELLFRERLLLALRGAGPVAAVLASSLLFALPHLEPWWMFGAFLMGLWLGALAWTSRGLTLCIGYHVGFNAACLAAGLPIRPRGTCVAALFSSSLALGAALRALRAPRPARVAVAGLAVLLAAASASAGVYDFAGELVLDPIAPALPPARIQGVGVATLNGSGGGIALETLALAGGIAGTATVPVTDPLVSNGGLTAMRVQARMGSGTLRPFQPPVSLSTPQLSAGALPIQGVARMCLLVSCAFGLDLPLSAATANGTIGLGVGGLIPVASLSTLRRSVLGAPWTPRTASIALPTPAGGLFTAFTSGFAHGPWSFTGSTAWPGGVLQLVTPLTVTSPSGVEMPTGFARLTLHFVPEPRSLFVLAPSIALLAAGARRRGRRGGST
jgi:membrane protease YdiL (CAAX protease family)